MVKLIWADIKKAFSSSLSKWIGGAVFTALLFFLWSTTTAAKKIYETPRKLETHMIETHENFELVFQNQQIQVENQAIIAKKIDSFLMVQKFKDISDAEFKQQSIEMWKEIRIQLYKKSNQQP